MIKNKNISKAFFLFLLIHSFIWTLAPSISNVNLPLDTIEALAWGSNLDWGFNKHPPLSAFVVETFYFIFGPIDWVYYLLSQIFVVIAFIYVWKLSNEIFQEKMFAFLSLITLEGIFFYNFTTPEFNVNVCQLPFWALSVYYFWMGLKENKRLNWVLFGIFSALGFLSKYLFIYILLSCFLFLLFNFKRYAKIIPNYVFSVMVSIAILIPHFFWLFENEFITIEYGLRRSSFIDTSLISHMINPSLFILKQFFILVPFFVMIFILLKKFKVNLNLQNRKILFLTFVTIVPLGLVIITSILTGANIRTMWMTPFYLFLGIYCFLIFKNSINLKRIKNFFVIFFIFFILSPISYLAVSILDDTKRTDYPGKEISRLVQNKWDNNFTNEIDIVIGDEWSAGNLSYHLISRPIWTNELKIDLLKINDHKGVIYTGNPKILKKVCPGVFGTIKPVGYCMIGKK